MQLEHRSEHYILLSFFSPDWHYRAGHSVWLASRVATPASEMFASTLNRLINRHSEDLAIPKDQLWSKNRAKPLVSQNHFSHSSCFQVWQRICFGKLNFFCFFKQLKCCHCQFRVLPSVCCALSYVGNSRSQIFLWPQVFIFPLMTRFGWIKI